MRAAKQRKEVELEELEEVQGEFAGHTTHGDFVIAILRGVWYVQLPSSASQALRHLKIGDRVAIVRIGDDVRVRLL